MSDIDKNDTQQARFVYTGDPTTSMSQSATATTTSALSTKPLIESEFNENHMQPTIAAITIVLIILIMVLLAVLLAIRRKQICKCWTTENCSLPFYVRETNTSCMKETNCNPSDLVPNGKSLSDERQPLNRADHRQDMRGMA